MILMMGGRMATYESVLRGRIEAGESLANALVVVPEKALDQLKTLAVLDVTAWGNRKPSAWQGTCWLRFELWGRVPSAGGSTALQEMGVLIVEIEQAHNCGQYYWQFGAHIEVSAGCTAVRWSVDWWDDLRNQQPVQALVWPVRLESVEVRMRYAPTQQQAGLPAVQSSAAHWSTVDAGTVKTVEV